MDLSPFYFFLDFFPRPFYPGRFLLDSPPSLLAYGCLLFPERIPFPLAELGRCLRSFAFFSLFARQTVTALRSTCIRPSSFDSNLSLPLGQLWKILFLRASLPSIFDLSYEAWAYPDFSFRSFCLLRRVLFLDEMRPPIRFLLPPDSPSTPFRVDVSETNYKSPISFGFSLFVYTWQKRRTAIVAVGLLFFPQNWYHLCPDVLNLSLGTRVANHVLRSS